MRQIAKNVGIENSDARDPSARDIRGIIAYYYQTLTKRTRLKKHSDMNDKPNIPLKRNNALLKMLILVVFAGGLIAFFALGGDQYLTLESIKSHRDDLLSYTQQYYLLMIAGTMVVYTISTALSIPGALILSLTTGFLFGRWTGTVIIVFSASIGSTLVFLAARYLFAEAAQRSMGAVAQKIIKGFHANAFNYLLFLRLVPVFPFWLVNLVPAFTPIKLRTYFTATAIGIVPGSFVFANLGQSLGRIESLDQLLSKEILIAFVLLGLFALIPVIVRKFKLAKNLKES